MRALTGIELKAVSGGLQMIGGYPVEVYDYGFGESSGGGGGGGGGGGRSGGGSSEPLTTGDFARMDGATYRSDSYVAPNYCGNATITVPNSFFGVNQNEACQKHDICYALAQDSRATCDVQFLSNMLTNCGPNLLCAGVAVIYFIGVSVGGGSSYATPLQ